MSSFLQDLKRGSTQFPNGVYLLKQPYLDKFPDHNCFVQIGDSIIFSQQKEPELCAQDAKQYFAALEKRHSCTLSSIEVAMSTAYQEGLYEVAAAAASTQPEQIDKIAINRRKAALGNPISDEGLLKGKDSGTFIFRESSSIAGAKTLAFINNKGEVGRYRLLVTAEDMIINIHNETAPKSIKIQELEKHAAAPLAASSESLTEQQENNVAQASAEVAVAIGPKSKKADEKEFVAHSNENNVSNALYDSVVENLKADSRRLVKKNGKKNDLIEKRIKAIDKSIEAIELLYENGQLSYGALKEKLTSLESEMISSNFLLKKLASLPSEISTSYKSGRINLDSSANIILDALEQKLILNNNLLEKLASLPLALQKSLTTSTKKIKKLKKDLLREQQASIKANKKTELTQADSPRSFEEKKFKDSDEFESQIISSAKPTTASANTEASFSSALENVDSSNIDTNNMSIISLDNLRSQSTPMGEDDDQFYMLPKAANNERDKELAEKLAKGFDCFICVGKNIIFSQLSQLSRANFGPMTKEEYFDAIAAKYDLDPVRFKNIMSGPLPQTLVEKPYDVTLDDCASVAGKLAKTITLKDEAGNPPQQHHFIQTNRGNIIEINISPDNHAPKPEIYTCPDLNYSPKSASTSKIAQAPHGVTEKLQDENKKQTVMKESSIKSTTENKLKTPAEQSQIRSAIGVARMPFIPKNVALADLNINGDKLLVLTQDEINAAKTQMENDGLDICHIEKTGKHETDKKKYTVIKMNNEYYIIYKGNEHKRHMEAGKYGTVKLMQNLDTGEWHNLKIIDHSWLLTDKIFLSLKTVKNSPKKEEAAIKIKAAIVNAFESVSIAPEGESYKEAGDSLNEALNKIFLSLGCPPEYSSSRAKSLTNSYFIEPVELARIEGGNLNTVKQAKGALLRIEIPTNSTVPKSTASKNIDKDSKKESDKFRLQSLIGMELAPGIDLIELASYKTLSASRWLQVAHGALHAISEIHNQGLMHRDIRGQNLIFDMQTAKVSVANFGSAGAAGAPSKKDGKYGAPGFIAPEYHTGSAVYNEKTEVFALGKTLAELFKLTQLIENKEAPLGEDYIIKILDTGSQKSHIKDPILRKELVAYLQQMTKTDPGERPTLKEAIDFFATKQNQLLDVFGQSKKTGILNLADYKNADKPALYKALKQFDQVLLVDTHQQHKKDYLSIRKELEENGIILSEKIFHVPAKKDSKPEIQALDIIQAIPARSHAEKSSSVDSFFYVVPIAASNQLTQAQKASLEEAKIGVVVTKSNKAEKDYAKELISHLQKHTVSQQHFDLVIDTLIQDRTRISNKPEENADIKTEKVIIIQMMIAELQELQYEGKLSYDSLQAKLSELESKLISNNFIVRKLIDLPFVPFKNHTTSAKEIKKLKAALRMEKATLITAEKKQKPHSSAKPELQTIADSTASQSEANDASTLDISSTAEYELETVADNTSALSDTSSANNFDTSSLAESEPQTEADFRSAISNLSDASQHDTSFSIQEAQFPFVPKNVDLSDLETVGDKFLLLTQSEITLAKNKMAEHNTNRWFIIKPGKNDDDKKQYAVIKMKVGEEDKYYAIYKGVKRGKEMGVGGFGKVKLMQDLDTAAWQTIKVIDHATKVSDINWIVKSLFRQVASKHNPDVVIKDVIAQLAAAFNSSTNTSSKEYLKVYEYCSDTYGLDKVLLQNKLETYIYPTLKSTEPEIENLKLVGQSKGSMLKSPYPDSIDKSKISFKRLIGMELAPGTDFYVLTCQPIPMPMSRVLLVAIKALQAVQDFHKQGLIHRDIKSENLMYDPVTDKVSVIDVGLALTKELAKAAESSVGTRLFAAPEIFSPLGETINYNEKTDVFALGKTIAELLQLAREEGGKLIIFDNKDSFISDPPRTELVSYLLKMTDDDPEKRPTIRKALVHFEKLQNETLEILGQFRKVGILNLEDYMAPGCDREALRAALTHFDQVVIVDAKKSYSEDYLSIRKELEGAGVMLTEKLYHAPAAKEMSALEIIGAIPSHTAAHDTQHIYSYFYVAPTAVKEKLNQEVEESEKLAKMKVGVIAAVRNKDTSQYTQDISQHHKLLPTTKTENALIREGLNLAKVSLINDLERLEGKVGDKKNSNKLSIKQKDMLDSRIKKIEKLIETIENDLGSRKPELNFESLQKLLTDLEKAMISTNKLTLKLAELSFTLHNTHSTSAKEIRKLQSTLQKVQASVPKDEVQPQIVPSAPGSSK